VLAFLDLEAAFFPGGDLRDEEVVALRAAISDGLNQKIQKNTVKKPVFKKKKLQTGTILTINIAQ